MALLSKILMPRLKEAFPAEKINVREGEKPFVSIEPRWPGFGQLELHDDGDEVTIYFGNFTHVHCGNYDELLGPEEKVTAIAEHVVQYLDDTFSDRLRFWTNPWGGGCTGIGEKEGVLEGRQGTRRGLWSRPLDA